MEDFAPAEKQKSGLDVRISAKQMSASTSTSAKRCGVVHLTMSSASTSAKQCGAVRCGVFFYFYKIFFYKKSGRPHSTMSSARTPHRVAEDVRFAVSRRFDFDPPGHREADVLRNAVRCPGIRLCRSSAVSSATRCGPTFEFSFIL
jgi:hypothetical protein